MAAISIGFTRFQRGDRKALKPKALGVEAFYFGLESALGTDGRMIVINDLQIGHLSKEQVVASDGAANIGGGGAALWKSEELSSSI
jgi:hypothetical protein